MSKIRVQVSRNYRGVPYSIEAKVEDFRVIGKAIRTVESFIENEVKRES
jgi:hypothetical protein